MTLTPEQIARKEIDTKLEKAGWVVQDYTKIDFKAGRGIAVREYPTDSGPADYMLLVDKKPDGVIEAKRADEGHRLTKVEEQSTRYATSELKHFGKVKIPFIYESNGEITRFTDQRAPKPRTLVQMATGSGKTFTAITTIYRLLKHAGANRVLFLVDTKNLGEQAEQEFMQYTPSDDNRKFTELYPVQRLQSSYIAPDNKMTISTIQRLNSMMKGEEIDESAEEENPNERYMPDEPLPVVYNEKIPIEFFDVIAIDECHCPGYFSIYDNTFQVFNPSCFF